MKVFTKIVIYTYTAICFVILFLHLFGPYGGLLSIWWYIKKGFYGTELLSVFDTSFHELALFLSKLIAAVFWLGILAPLIVVFMKISAERKRNIILLCIAWHMMIVFIPKLFGIT